MRSQPHPAAAAPQDPLTAEYNAWQKSHPQRLSFANGHVRARNCDHCPPGAMLTLAYLLTTASPLYRTDR